MIKSQQIHSSLLNDDNATSNLNLNEYTSIIKPLLKPSSAIFWIDFLASATLGNLFIYLATTSVAFSSVQIFYIFMGAIFLYRTSVFVHEDSHSGKRIKGFSIAYNIFFGYLHKLPSYAYTPHRNHHSQKLYGTLDDPEYDLLADRPVPTLFIGFITMILFPPILIFRFGILPALLPFIGSKGRELIYQYASTLVLNLRFVRNKPEEGERKKWYLQDFWCFTYNTAFFTLMYLGILPWDLLIIWCVTTYVAYTMNYYRVIASHSYLSNFQPTSYKQQVLDSWTVIKPWWITLWCFPVGLKYHALHHMYPSLPYHNMGKAHDLLLQNIPDDHPYRKTIQKSYFSAIGNMIVNMRKWASGN